MRVLITGDMATPGAVARALDAAHNKRRIVIVLVLSGINAAAIEAEAWAGAIGVLSAEVHEVEGRVNIFDIADSIIALPGTSAEFLDMARKAGVKVWEPYKQQSAL